MTATKIEYDLGEQPVPEYTLRELLGEGSFGKTYSAIGPGEIEVAVKIVNKRSELGYRRELEGLNRIKNLSHNHLCRIYGFWVKDANGQLLDTRASHVDDPVDQSPPQPTQETNDSLDTLRIPDAPTSGSPKTPARRAVQLIIAMELGHETLWQVLHRSKPKNVSASCGGIPVDELMKYILGVGKALHFLNEKHHICHCDVKPSNIILAGGEAKLCDYGLVQEVNDSRETTNLSCTVAYGAPEMLTRNAYHRRMDQYSLALTYAELRTGKFPFSEVSRERMTAEKLAGEFQLGDMPTAERGVIARALSPDPEDRYPSVEDFCKTLQRAIDEPAIAEPGPAPPPPKPPGVLTQIEYGFGEQPVPEYTLREMLGEGSFGKTYRAIGPGEIEVAVKIVNKRSELGYRRELEGLNRIKNLSHNHLCRIYGFWVKDANGQLLDTRVSHVDEPVGQPPPQLTQDTNDSLDTLRIPDDATSATPKTPARGAVQLIIAMELGDETLGQVLDRSKPKNVAAGCGGIPVDELMKYILGVGKALHFLNEKHHICHCDVKPRNIILAGGEAKLCDYGLVQEVNDSRETTNLSCTVAYGAPEMLTRNTYHRRMDQYSLAITYAELRTGKFPFSGTSRERMTTEKLAGEFKLGDMPAAEREVIARALSPDPEDRYPSVADFCNELQRAIDEPGPAPPLPKPPGVLTQAARAVGGLALVMVLAWLGYRSLFPSRGNGNPENSGNGRHSVGPQGDGDESQRDVSGPPNDPSATAQGSDAGVNPSVTDSPATRRLLTDILNDADQHLRDGKSLEAKELLKSEEVPRGDQVLADRLNLYRIRVAAFDQGSPTGGMTEDQRKAIQELLKRNMSGAPRLSDADLSRLLLLDAVLPVNATEFSLEDLDDLLARVERMRTLSEQLDKNDKLRDWESSAWQSADHRIGMAVLERWPQLPPNQQRKALSLWPGPSAEFQKALEQVIALAACGSDQGSDNPHTDPLQLLSQLESLARTAEEKELSAAIGHYGRAMESVKRNDIAAAFEELNSLIPMLGRLPSEHPGVEKLFAALADVLQAKAVAGELAFAQAESAWRLWGEYALETSTSAAQDVDTRLRTIVTIARIEENPLNEVGMSDARPLIEDAQCPLVVVAAMAEGLIKSGQSDTIQTSIANRLTGKTIASDPFSVRYADYIRLVRASLLPDFELKKAAEDLSELSRTSPGMTGRRREDAANVLRRAAHAERQALDDNDLKTEAYTQLAGIEAIKYLEKARDLAPETEGAPGDGILIGPDTDWLLAAAASGKLDAASILRESNDLLEHMHSKKIPSTGQLLFVRVQAALKLAQSGIDEDKDTAARACGELAEWLEIDNRNGRFRTLCKTPIEEGVGLFSGQPPFSTILEMDLDELMKHLPVPEDQLGQALTSVAASKSVGSLWYIHGTFITHDIDDTGLLTRFRSLLLASWLTKSPDHYFEAARALFQHSEKQTKRVQDLPILTAVEKLAERACSKQVEIDGGKRRAEAEWLLGLACDRRAGYEPSVPKRAALLETAIKHYRAAIAATPNDAIDKKVKQARYYIHISNDQLATALLFYIDGYGAPRQQSIAPGTDVLDFLEKVRINYQEDGKIASRRALTLLDDSKASAETARDLTAEADAHLAIGNVEEDMEHYARELGGFARELGGFDRAEESFRQAENAVASAVTKVSIQRCRFRRLQSKLPEPTSSEFRREAETIRPELESIRKGLEDSVNDKSDPAIRAESLFWQAQVSSLLAEYSKEQNAYHEAARISREGGLLMMWADCQNEWLKTLQNTQDKKNGYREILEVAKSPDWPAINSTLFLSALKDLPPADRNYTDWIAECAKRGDKATRVRLLNLTCSELRSSGGQDIDATKKLAEEALNVTIELVAEGDPSAGELLGTSLGELGLLCEAEYRQTKKVGDGKIASRHLDLAVSWLNNYIEQRPHYVDHDFRALTERCNWKLAEVISSLLPLKGATYTQEQFELAKQTALAACVYLDTYYKQTTTPSFKIQNLSSMRKDINSAEFEPQPNRAAQPDPVPANPQQPKGPGKQNKGT